MRILRYFLLCAIAPVLVGIAAFVDLTHPEHSLWVLLGAVCALCLAYVYLFNAGKGHVAKVAHRFTRLEQGHVYRVIADTAYGEKKHILLILHEQGNDPSLYCFLVDELDRPPQSFMLDSNYLPIAIVLPTELKQQIRSGSSIAS